MSSDRPPPRRQRRRRQQARTEDTIVAYHNYLKQLIKERLNAIDLGPGKTPCRIAIGLYILGVLFLIVGILVIGLRSRHVYLTGVWSRFVGPLFVIFFLLSFGAATFFLDRAKRKSNKYRRNLKPLGQFGVKVVHTTRLSHERTMREEYSTGSMPHAAAKPPRQHRGYGPRYGQSNRGYLPDNGQRAFGREYGHEQQGPSHGQYHNKPPQRQPQGVAPPDVVPGQPRQYKSRVVIQQQQHVERGPPPEKRGYTSGEDSFV